MAKTIVLLLSSLSAAGVSYFAAKNLFELGDWGYVWSQDPRILIVALIVSLIPLASAWATVWFVSEAKTPKGQLIKLVLMSIFSWAWLYIGSIYLALLRFQ